jgi:hypothetical protein
MNFTAEDGGKVTKSRLGTDVEDRNHRALSNERETDGL